VAASGQTLSPAIGPSLQVAPSPSVDLSENRRLVTILFADLSGSTQLGERLDPEDLRQFLTAYFAAASRHIQRFGGTVDKFIGDAVMAVFGAPVAHEDDPERAINAALSMQAAFKQLNDELESKHGVSSGLRVGINTGEVVAGLLAAEIQGAYTVVGDTVNTAQRIEDAAPLGGILVSDSTWRLTQRAFEFEALSPLVLRGKSEPQPAFRVVRRLLTELSIASSPLIGRVDELDRLNAVVQAASTGQGQFLHVIGEAGVGKSRLVREFRSNLDPRWTQVVVRCASFEVDTPYALVSSILRDLLQVPPGASESAARLNIRAALESVDERDAQLLLHVLGLGEHLTFDPQSSQRVLVALMRRLLVPKPGHEPLLLVAEDLHWCDAVSAEVLTELCRHFRAAACLVLSSSRPGWDPPWSVERLELQALPEHGARSLVEVAFGQPVHADLAETVLARTGGNPFFIEEVVRGLVESRALQDKAGVLTIDSARAVRVPATIQEVLGARLDRLAPPARRVLQPAAVCGRTFSEDVLHRVLHNGSLATNLITLEQESLIVDRSVEVEGTYAFRHALIQEVAYQNQLQSQRRTFHGAIGEALEVLYPDRVEELIGELAFHYARSDDNTRALHWLVRAADRARRLFANQEALSYYASALQRAEQGEGLLQAGTILERIGDLQHLMGRYDEAIASFANARTRIPAPTPPTLGRLQRKVGTALRIKGDYAEAEQILQDARAALGDIPDVELAHIDLQVGQLHWRTGEYAAARDALNEAVTIASTFGDDEVLAEGLKQLGNIPLHSGDPHEAVELFQRSRTIYQRLEDLAGIAMARLNLGTAYGRLGRWEDCLAELNASLTLFERIGDQWHIAIVHNNLGELYRESGDLQRSIASFERALAICKEVGYAAGVANALAGLGSARVESGAIEQGRADLMDAAERFTSLGRSMYMPHIHRFLASAELAAGNLDAALEHATRSVAFARENDARHEEAMTQRVLAEIALARNDPATARQLLEASRRTLADVGEAAELARTEAVLRRLG